MNTTAANILHELRDAGVAVEAKADKLRLKAPAGVLTPPLAERIKAHKADLLALLKGDAWHDRSDRDRFATSDRDASQGKPAYSPSDAPLPELASIDEAALDLMILSYACGRRARMLASLGDCPADLAEQIHNNLKPVARITGTIHKEAWR